MTNEQYVTARNALIPDALFHAYQVAGHQPIGSRPMQAWTDKWNKAFHTEMNRLAEEKGLIGQRRTKHILDLRWRAERVI